MNEKIFARTQQNPYMSTMIGFRVVQNPLITGEPPAPRSDDMRDMVDNLRQHGQVHRVPAMFLDRVSNIIYTHPKLYGKVRRQLECR